MTFHVPRRALAVIAGIGLLAIGVGAGFLIFGGGGEDTTTVAETTTAEPSTASEDPAPVEEAPPNPDGRYRIDCDYLLGDGLDNYSFVASGTLRNTGNIGIVTEVTVEWEQIGADPVVHEETVEIAEGKTEEVQVDIPVTGDQIDRIQSGSGRYCDSNVKIVDTFRGASGGVSGGGETGFEPYTSEQGGWVADIPVGDGWSTPLESEPTPGQLYRTEIPGPEGAVLIVDSTPFEAPTFNAVSQSRETVSHPVFGSAEKIIFQGSENISSCAQGTCVDYLLTDASGGGFAVLAGGPGDFDQLQELAERVMLSLKPYDV